MKQKQSGVSAVVGVAIMVAITFILAAVISGFVFDLTERFGSSPSGNVNIQQQLSDFANEKYNATVQVRRMKNSDYLLVGVPENSGVTYSVDYIRSPPSGEDAPITVKGSSSLDRGRVVVSAGDKVSISGLNSGDNILVVAGDDGEESTVQRYTVKDVIPSEYG